MPNKTSTDLDGETIKTTRRAFFSFLPLGIFAGISGAMLTAGFRFLRPLNIIARPSWADVAKISDLKGDRPILKRIFNDVRAAWSISKEEHFVYVLPGKSNTVLSGTCPHEGCNVAWNDAMNSFTCPCHDSLFAADGTYVKGPARRGLDPLPSREQDGVLQVQYVAFVNNTSDREIIQ